MINQLPIKISLPDYFFKEEERFGYVISEQMKKVWAVELDLLFEFDRVCNKYNLKWFADSGTLLGAVRHNGFIPWDDDIDVVMFRDDYDKLCNVAKSEFQHPYFWATALTNKGAVRGYAQLQNDLTTAIQVGHVEKKYSFHQGIFLDIFPLDNVPSDKHERDILISKIISTREQLKSIAGCTFMYRPHLHEGCKKYTKHLLKHILFELLNKSRQYEMIVNQWYETMTTYNREPTEYVVQVMMPNVDKQMVKRMWYEDVIYMNFENTSIPIPVGYEEILQNFYGNWNEIVRGGSMHECFFDPEKPYTQYVE